MQYTCPMHPDIIRQNPGKCPKCGMDLIRKDAVPVVPAIHGTGIEKTTWKSYLPLIIIIGIILAASIVAARSAGSMRLQIVVLNFMTGFFLAFSGFKLIDLKGFAAGYSTYDLLAQKVFAYGYIYPFLELLFGLAMLAGYHGTAILAAEAAIMLFSGIGVAIKIAKHETFQCVCLGTFLKVPLTSVTLVEDFGMGFLALLMLILLR